MNERKMTTLLMEALDAGELADRVASIDTFEEAGVLTRNKGLVVTMVDGSAFQITVVQSAPANKDEE